MTSTAIFRSRAFLMPLGVGLLLMALVAVLEPPRRTVAEQRYAIPPGTAERAKAGLPVGDALPRRIETTVGRHVVVVNEDTAQHVFGPFLLLPGQRWNRQFGSPGEFKEQCSVYPTTGFTIAVAPAIEAVGPATLVHRGWALAWALLGAVLMGAVGLAGVGVMGSEEDGAAVGTMGLEGDGVHAGTSFALLDPDVSRGAGTSSLTLATAWSSLTIVLGTTGLLALSRVADWQPVLTSPAATFWTGAALVALALAGLTLRGMSRAREEILPPTARVFVSQTSLGFLILTLGLWPFLSGRALGTALAVVGLGWLGRAWLADRDPGAGTAAKTGLRRLAVAGFALILAGLPWPMPTPPLQAAFGLAGLVLGLGLLVWERRGRSKGRVTVDELPVQRDGAGRSVIMMAGGIVASVAFVVFWMAIIHHIAAVTLPLYGMPVANDAASRARGAAVWEARCAGCHVAGVGMVEGDGTGAGTVEGDGTGAGTVEGDGTGDRGGDRGNFSALGDRDLLEVITHGKGKMRGFAYELGLAERVDVVNWLRGGGGTGP